ncbi:MAG: hypothetical protein R3B72_50200 [Polyangiaceae bacterium]
MNSELEKKVPGLVLVGEAARSGRVRVVELDPLHVATLRERIEERAVGVAQAPWMNTFIPLFTWATTSAGLTARDGNRWVVWSAWWEHAPDEATL